MNGVQFGWDAEMGRGCSCCSKDARSCCPEDVFIDEDSAIAFYILYKHESEDKNISIEFETEKLSRSSVLTFDVENGKTYYFRFIFSKTGSISLDKSPMCDSGCPPPISAPRPDFITTVLNLYSSFDSDRKTHTLKAWVDGIRTGQPSGTSGGPQPVVNFSAALYCIKKYSGSPDYIYNEQSQLAPTCKSYSYILTDGVYYNSAAYNYDGEHWTNGGKYGCICMCTDITTSFLPDYEVEDNIEITYDNCGVVDGLYNIECDKTFYFTVTSRSAETGKTYTCTNVIDFQPFQAVYTIQYDDEEPYEYIRPLFFNERYLPPIAKVLKPFSKTDVVTVTIDFSYQHIDCEGFLGCENCGSSREPCFCFKDSYSLSANTFELRYTSPCVLEYDSSYTVDVHRTYRSRNLSVNFTKFNLIVSNIYIDFDPLFWTEECKESYRNLVKALEGTYTFSLANDGCGTFTEFTSSKEIIGQSSFPCRCFSSNVLSGNLNLDLYRQAYDIGVGTCRGLAPASSSFSDGVAGADAEGVVGYSLRGTPSDDSGCFTRYGGGPLVPVPNYNIDLILQAIEFIFDWRSGPCNTILQAVNQKISYCKGCEYTDKNIDLSQIKYRLSELLGGIGVPTFDCDLEGYFS